MPITDAPSNPPSRTSNGRGSFSPFGAKGPKMRRPTLRMPDMFKHKKGTPVEAEPSDTKQPAESSDGADKTKAQVALGYASAAAAGATIGGSGGVYGVAAGAALGAVSHHYAKDDEELLQKHSEFKAEFDKYATTLKELGHSEEFITEKLSDKLHGAEDQLGKLEKGKYKFYKLKKDAKHVVTGKENRERLLARSADGAALGTAAGLWAAPAAPAIIASAAVTGVTLGAYQNYKSDQANEDSNPDIQARRMMKSLVHLDDGKSKEGVISAFSDIMDDAMKGLRNVTLQKYRETFNPFIDNKSSGGLGKDFAEEIDALKKQINEHPDLLEDPAIQKMLEVSDAYFKENPVLNRGKRGRLPSDTTSIASSASSDASDGSIMDNVAKAAATGAATVTNGISVAGEAGAVVAAGGAVIAGVTSLSGKNKDAEEKRRLVADTRKDIASELEILEEVSKKLGLGEGHVQDTLMEHYNNQKSSLSLKQKAKKIKQNVSRALKDNTGAAEDNNGLGADLSTLLGSAGLLASSIAPGGAQAGALAGTTIAGVRGAVAAGRASKKYKGSQDQLIDRTMRMLEWSGGDLKDTAASTQKLRDIFGKILEDPKTQKQYQLEQFKTKIGAVNNKYAPLVEKVAIEPEDEFSLPQ